MNNNTASTLRLAALRDHAANELREAAKGGPDALDHIREAQAALQRGLELERGYVLDREGVGQIMRVEAELLRSEGIDPAWPGFGEEAA